MARKKSTPTRTSKRRTLKRAVYAGLTALVLAGCEGVPAFSFGSLSIDTERGRIATQEVTLASGLRIRAPFGKCVDTRRTRQAGVSATVVMANCSNLGGRADIGARVPGIILVTVTPGSHGDPIALREAVRTNPGLLARSGLASDVELISATASSAALYVNLVDVSEGGPDGVSERHWKAAVDVAGRAVVISIFGEEAGPLTGKEGESLARDVAQALLEVNAETALPAAPPIGPSAETPIETPPERSENTPNGLLQGLFERRQQ